MNQLYPIKFKPILKDKIWGGDQLRNFAGKEKASVKCGESWEISSINGSVSIVAEGFLKGNTLTELIEIYMGDLVGDTVFDKFGLEFPLLIKFIHAKDILSIQVHPDDELAMERHQSNGKNEMWYIIDAEEGSSLISGFRMEMDREKYISHLNEGTLESILNYEKVKSGDIFNIPAGRVHAIGSGILLAEIQQTSDLTYRIYDFNRKDDEGNLRELHTELALKAIDFKKYDSYKTDYLKEKNKTITAVSTPYFNTNVIHFNVPVEKDFNFIDSFVIYMCTEGEVELNYHQSEKLVMKKGETVLVPAELKNISLIPKKESNLLEIYLK
jgi:mannose-6-phosphate isomerase